MSDFTKAYDSNFKVLSVNTTWKKISTSQFICAKAKSFKLYAEFANFEKDFCNVDQGNGYLNDKPCPEIVKYISLSSRMKKITEPLNSNTLNYYSVLFDGGSSAKCVDEKEISLTKKQVEI